LFTRCTRNFS